MIILISLRTIIKLWLMLIVLVGLVRSLAFDAAHFQQVQTALSAPDSCEGAPCYLGIQPGRTNADAAITALQNHRWVQGVQTMAGFFAITSDDTLRAAAPTVEWAWNGTQPGYFAQNASLETTARQYIVQVLLLPTHLNLAEIWLAFGAPPAATVDATHVVLQYNGFGFRASASCPDFWQQPATLFVTAAAVTYPTPNLRAIVCAR